MNNNFNIKREFIKILNSRQLTKEQFESEIVNLICSINNDDFNLLLNLIDDLKSNPEKFGLEEYELNNRYNLADGSWHYQNDLALTKLIFDNKLFEKINNLDNNEEKINLINKVFELANNVKDIRGHCVKFLVENIAPKVFSNFDNDVRSFILTNIINTIDMDRDPETVDMSIGSLFENIYKFNFDRQGLIDFTNSILKTVMNDLDCDFSNTVESIERVLNERGIEINEVGNFAKLYAAQNNCFVSNGCIFIEGEILGSFLQNVSLISVIDIKNTPIYNAAINFDKAYEGFLKNSIEREMLESTKRAFFNELLNADNETKKDLLSGIIYKDLKVVWFVKDNKGRIHNLNEELEERREIDLFMIINALEQRQTNQENMQEESEYEDIVAMPVNTQPRVFASDEEKALEEQLHNERMNFIKSVSKSYNKRKARVAKSKRILNKPRLKTSRRLNGNRKAKDNSRYL